MRTTKVQNLVWVMQLVVLVLVVCEGSDGQTSTKWLLTPGPDTAGDHEVTVASVLECIFVAMAYPEYPIVCHSKDSLTCSMYGQVKYNIHS